MIILDQVKKVFQTSSGQVTAVDSVNLEIKKGEIFGIIGYSGAGKSTLIRMLNLLERPTDGTVTIDGKDLTKVSALSLIHILKPPDFEPLYYITTNTVFLTPTLHIMLAL